MKAFCSRGARLPGLAAVALWLALGLPAFAQGTASKVPPAISGLLPKTAVLKSGSWAVFPTEFGKTFGGDLHAGFTGKPMSCDITIGPELRVSIKGDTAWEAPPMLDMAVALHNEQVAKARKSLPERLARLRSSNRDVKSVGAPKEEKLPAGTILYAEYTENCARHPNGTNTVLLAHARKGATMLSVDLWISAGAAEAKAMAAEMLARFQGLDTAALAK